MTKPTEISGVLSPQTIKGNATNVRDLENFVIYKRAFPNSRIYNYSASKVERTGRIKSTRNTIAKTIARFIQLGWAHKSGKHVILISKHKLSAMHGSKGHRKKRIDTTKNIGLQIKSFIIKSELDRARFGKSCQEAQSNRNRQKYAEEIREIPQELSSHKIGQVFGKSQTQGLRIVKSLEKSGFLQVHRSRLLYLGSCSAKAWELRSLWWSRKEDLNKCFWHLGHFFFLPCNSYKVTELL